jgi:hypothetical protein
MNALVIPTRNNESKQNEYILPLLPRLACPDNQFDPPLRSSNPMADPPAKRRKTALTALAEKYGHPTGSNDDIIQGYVPLKSGLTPLNPGPFRTVAEKVLYEKMVEYQRKRLKGETKKSCL